jgi:hypothetical protein
MEDLDEYQRRFTVVIAGVLFSLMIAFPLGLKMYEHTLPPPDLTLTKVSLYKEISKYPFQDCTLVWKSAIQEAGHDLHSLNVRVNNNLFGMKCSKRVKDCKRGMSVYESWQASVEDRYLHEKLYYRGGSYRGYMDRHWGIMDGTYCKNLDRIKFTIK